MDSSNQQTRAALVHFFTQWSVNSQDAAPTTQAIQDSVECMVDQWQLGHVCWLCEDPARLLALAQSALVSCDEQTPLVIDWIVPHETAFLYLARYFYYEKKIATHIAARLRWQPVVNQVPEFVRSKLSDHDTPEQVRCYELALCVPFLLITGGPGTGKTTTIVKMICILLAAQPQWRVIVVAPTGKAAARLESAMRAYVPPGCIDAMPHAGLRVMTIHRLLRQKQAPWWTQACIGADVLIVDELSMVDLALANELLDALSEQTRLIFVGDAQQLPAVEAGSLLEGLTQASLGVPEESHSCAQNVHVILQHCYRFAGELAALCHAVIQNSDTFIEILQRADGQTIIWQNALFTSDQLPAILEEYATFLASTTSSIGECIQLFSTHRILTAHRLGKWGAVSVNEAIVTYHRQQSNGTEPYYDGLPVIMTANDASLDLCNGDVGLFFKKDEQWRVYFSTTRAYLPVQLPRYEYAYAMTVHKAQGSEFDTVSLILPAEDSPILSRSWLYTALTRAKKKIRLVAQENVLRHALSQHRVRSSGLYRRLADAIRLARGTLS